MTPCSRHRAAGQSLAEFALVIPVFLLLTMAILDAGRAVYAYNTVANAARDAARVAIVDQNPDAVTDVALAKLIGMDPAVVEVDFVACPEPAKIGCPVEVTVRYDWTAITPVIGSILGPIQLESTTRMPVERVHAS